MPSCVVSQFPVASEMHAEMAAHHATASTAPTVAKLHQNGRALGVRWTRMAEAHQAEGEEEACS